MPSKPTSCRKASALGLTFPEHHHQPRWNREGFQNPFYEKPDWAKGLDIIVHNECFAVLLDVGWVRRITAPRHDGGVSAVVIHCAIHSYREAQTDEWNKFLGVASHRHE